MKKISLAVVTVLFLILDPAKAVAAGYEYKYTDLGRYEVGNSYAYAINNNGLIVGEMGGRPVKWENGGMKYIGGLSTYFSSRGSAIDVNDAGDIVGSAWTDEYEYHATIWTEGQVKDLGVVAGQKYSSASVINNKGVVGGTVAVEQGYSAALWSSHSMSILERGPGNDSGMITGMNDVGDILYREERSGVGLIGSYIIMASGSKIILRGLDGINDPQANGINNYGSIVGSSSTKPPRGERSKSHATLWVEGDAHDLGALPGFEYSSAFSISNSGFIVGESYSPVSGVMAGTLWANGDILDLNDFLDPSDVSDGWVIKSAVDVNDAGAIVGYASNKLTGAVHAYLLSPIPEPGTYALMLAGLGAVAGAARARRRASC